ncbi:MAG: hypothetical protein U9N80_01535 [Chloroflexota bacterium]|nr:hypothetical protein [Chloroflexota bacterium]
MCPKIGGIVIKKTLGSYPVSFITSRRMMGYRERSRAMDLSLLKAYHGYQSSIIPFSSGYYLYLATWDSTPTDFPCFSNIWVVTPENKRILFSDPPASSEIVCIYHDFHEIQGASISFEWASEYHLLVECEALNGAHKLSAEIYLQETLASRLLVTIASSPPTQLMVSKPMVAISNFLVSMLVAKGGSALYGKTETGQLFYNGAADRLFRVSRGSATLNGDDLGEVSSPTWPVEFGDAVPFVQPVIKLGTLYIPYEKEMLKDSV